MLNLTLLFLPLLFFLANFQDSILVFRRDRDIISLTRKVHCASARGSTNRMEVCGRRPAGFCAFRLLIGKLPGGGGGGKSCQRRADNRRAGSRCHTFLEGDPGPCFVGSPLVSTANLPYILVPLLCFKKLEPSPSLTYCLPPVMTMQRGAFQFGCQRRPMPAIPALGLAHSTDGVLTLYTHLSCCLIESGVSPHLCSFQISGVRFGLSFAAFICIKKCP